jgi:hypothetical protein
VRDTPAEANDFASCGVKRFVPVCDARRAVQNREMLIFVLVNVYRRAVASLRDDLNDRICAVGVRG